MAQKHLWRIKKEYFQQLKNGKKRIEVRVGYDWVKAVKAGDTISFENYGPNEFYVVRVKAYADFERMLKVEGTKKVLPGMTYQEALNTLREIYHRDKESLGVYVFELKYQSEASTLRSYVSASDLVKAGKRMKFSKLVAESYMVTDWISDDYPDHVEHFYAKYVPGVFAGEREIISCYVGGKIAATAFLKKDEEERKISTFFVRPEYQKQGIATELIEKCFDWLGTTKPVITIADYKVDQFAGIIKKYSWEKTNTLDEGYYNSHSRECVFNDI